METYHDFLARINSFEKPELGMNSSGFAPSNSVLQKVGEQNQLCAFYGDTVVFDLDGATKDHISGIIDQLYGEVPECFSERLDRKSVV